VAEETRAITAKDSGEAQIWALEYRVHRLGEMLSENIENTKINIEKKLARTTEELEAEIYDDDEDEDVEPEEEAEQDVRSM
jgi:hypothetical protein